MRYPGCQIHELLLRLLQVVIGCRQEVFFLGHAGYMEQQRHAHLLKGTGQVADLIRGGDGNGLIVGSRGDLPDFEH